MSWVLKEDVMRAVARGGPSRFDEQIDVAVSVPVGESDAVAFWNAELKI
jgi:hypothetical protein